MLCGVGQLIKCGGHNAKYNKEKYLKLDMQLVYSNFVLSKMALSKNLSICRKKLPRYIAVHYIHNIRNIK
jgi:hypothetical protein